jgi:hypothetical protein
MHEKNTWKWEVWGAGDDSRDQVEAKKGKCEGKGQCQIVTCGQGTTMSLEVHCKKSDDSY